MLYIMFTCLCLHFRDFQLFFLWILVWCMCVIRRGLWVCMQSLVVNTGYLPWFSLPHFRDRISHWTWRSSLAGLASQRAPETYLSLYPNHGVWAYCVTIPGFYVVLGDPNSGSCIHMARMLPTEPSSKPQIFSSWSKSSNSLIHWSQLYISWL